MVFFYKRVGRGMEKLGEGAPMFFFYENQQGAWGGCGYGGPGSK
jgi:hypothetical protein